jgi:hypothetical protein
LGLKGFDVVVVVEPYSANKTQFHSSSDHAFRHYLIKSLKPYMAGLKRITRDAKRNSCTQIAKQHGLQTRV